MIENQQAADKLDYFRSIIQGLNVLDEQKRKQMNDTLAVEARRKADVQGQNAKQYIEELMEEVEAAANTVNAIRTKIQQSHANGPGDCFLKAKLSQYEKRIPKIDTEGVKKLLDRDLQICNEVPERVNDELVQQIQQNYEKFMTQQKQTLAAFIQKQQKAMYGIPWEPELSKMMGIFENNHVAEPNKEWPTMEIVEQWPLDKKIKLHKIAYKHTHNHYSLTGIKLVFTNGIESPDIQCGHGPQEAWKYTEALDEYTIKKVAIRVDHPSGDLDEMKVWDTEDKLIVDIVIYTESNGNWVEHEVPEEHEIIGLSCSTKKHNDITTLRFLTWKPNPTAQLK